jgi:hypothetical protein
MFLAAAIKAHDDPMRLLSELRETVGAPPRARIQGARLPDTRDPLSARRLARAAVSRATAAAAAAAAAAMGGSWGPR